MRWREKKDDGGDGGGGGGGGVGEGGGGRSGRSRGGGERWPRSWVLEPCDAGGRRAQARRAAIGSGGARRAGSTLSCALYRTLGMSCDASAS